MVPRSGLEPECPLQAADFKSDVYTNFTTEANFHKNCSISQLFHLKLNFANFFQSSSGLGVKSIDRSSMNSDSDKSGICDLQPDFNNISLISLY